MGATKDSKFAAVDSLIVVVVELINGCCVVVLMLVDGGGLCGLRWVVVTVEAFPPGLLGENVVEAVEVEIWTPGFD